MYLYINGNIVDKNEAVISPYDHGFLYGMGLFETFRVYNGHPFLLDDHLQRLNAGLKAMNIQARYSREQVVEALYALLEKNNFGNAYIRMNVSAGSGEIGLQTAPYLQPNLIIFPKPMPSEKARHEKRAVVLKLPRNTPEGLERLKSHHYMNNILAKREIGDVQDCEGIFLTGTGFLAEGIVSNLFWIKDQVLYTPSIETGILNGITRQFVLKLASEMGLETREGFYRLKEVLEADEVFVTNSIQEIVAISAIEGKPMPGIAGKKVGELHSNYQQYCESLWSKEQL